MIGTVAVLRLLVRLAPSNLPRGQYVAINGDVLVFAVAVALMGSVLIALAPMQRLRGLTATLHGRTMAPAGSPGQRWLLVAQVAVGHASGSLLPRRQHHSRRACAA